MSRISSAAIVPILIFAFIVLSACGSAVTVQTEEATPFTPITLIDSNPFTIATIVNTSSPYFDQAQRDMDYLQELLKQRGWNIRLRVEAAIPDAITGETSYSDTLQLNGASGGLADGYQLWAKEAHGLAKSGLVKNLSGLVRDTSPVLYDKYCVYFDKDGFGVPMSATRTIWGPQTVLYLKKGLSEGFNEQQMSMTRLLSVMEANNSLKIGFSIGGSFYCVTEALRIWAGEQGYYPLEKCGIYGELYAMTNDVECTPVPVENIPGFEEVFEKILRYNEEGRFFDLWKPETYGEDAAGYVGPLTNQMEPSILMKLKATGSDFLAFQLQGCEAPMLPADDPYVIFVLAAPTQCRNAEQLVLFATWAHTAVDGYDLIRYGVEGVDHRFVNDRIEYLNKGEPMAEVGWDLSTSMAYEYHRSLMFYSDELDHVTIYASDNYELLKGDLRVAEFPILTIKGLQVPFYTSRELFYNIHDEFTDIIGNRQMFLSGTVYTENKGNERGNCEKCTAGLISMEKETASLVEAYREKIWQLLHEE